MELVETANGQTIDLAVDDEFTVRLPENPTTGHRWELRSRAAAVCRVESDKYEAPQAAHGAGGDHVWGFRAMRSGAAELLFVYRRPWDKPADPQKTFALRIRVA